jgi:hypothetical protein
MPEWNKTRALIAVRTYPSPSAKSVEVSCTAAVTNDGRWIRLFPVPYRLMEGEKRFKKWDWIDVSVARAAGDARPESHNINVGSIEIGESVGPQDGWRARRQILEPLRRPSMCDIQDERNRHSSPTLGFFRPLRIDRLHIDPCDPNWTPEQLARLTQSNLFEKAPEQTLEKIPFEFRYEFHCGDVDCNGHKMMCTDWEMGEAYRRWRMQYGENWEGPFRNRFEKEMIEKFDTHFFVGTVHQHPGSWIIVGCSIRPNAKPIYLADYERPQAPPLRAAVLFETLHRRERASVGVG